MNTQLPTFKSRNLPKYYRLFSEIQCIIMRLFLLNVIAINTYKMLIEPALNIQFNQKQMLATSPYKYLLFIYLGDVCKRNINKFIKRLFHFKVSMLGVCCQAELRDFVCSSYIKSHLKYVSKNIFLLKMR